MISSISGLDRSANKSNKKSGNLLLRDCNRVTEIRAGATASPSSACFRSKVGRAKIKRREQRENFRIDLGFSERLKLSGEKRRTVAIKASLSLSARTRATCLLSFSPSCARDRAREPRERREKETSSVLQPQKPPAPPERRWTDH